MQPHIPGIPIAARQEVATDLLRQVLRDFGTVSFQVHGTSMAPALLPGDVVTVVRCRQEDVRCGDVVLFHRHRRVFLHRVVEVLPMGEMRLRTRGDRLRDFDLPISRDEFLGRATAVRRGASSLPWPTQSAFFLRTLCRHSDIATSLLVSQRWLRRLLRP